MVRKFFLVVEPWEGKHIFGKNVSSGRLLVHTADMPHGSADVCKTFAFSNISYTFLVTVFFATQYFGISIFRRAPDRDRSIFKLLNHNT